VAAVAVRLNRLSAIAGASPGRCWIDLQVEVARLSLESIALAPGGESSESVRERVVAARNRQLERSPVVNARLEGRQLESICRIEQQQHGLLERAMDRLGLSARAYHRILRVARTIADLAGAETIGQPHLAEAIGYRKLDRAG
jgi:magnesium chelatase family protein